MIKRMSVAVLKRSHQIYSDTYNQDSTLIGVQNLYIQDGDDSQEIRDKTFDTFQEEISSEENFIVGNPFDPRVATDANIDEFGVKQRRKRSQIMAESENARRLLEHENDISSTTDFDQETDDEDIVQNQTELYNENIQKELLSVTNSTSNEFILQQAAQSTSYPESSHVLLKGEALPRLGVQKNPGPYAGLNIERKWRDIIEVNSSGGEILKAPVETTGKLCSSIKDERPT
jgi:hypothetical protein